MARRLIAALTASIVLSGCGGSDFSDLDQYMAEMRARPVGTIDPIPTFKPYKAFTYEAQAERPPFDPMPKFEAEDVAGGESVQPDLNRAKEYLEGFSIESLSMVGTLEQRGQRWALINDGTGGVHRVRVGNYLGQDYGRIEEITEAYVKVVEIAATGSGSWARRPRIIELNERN